MNQNEGQSRIFPGVSHFFGVPKTYRYEAKVRNDGMEAKVIAQWESHKNKQEQVFEYIVFRHATGSQDSYWLHTIQVRHPEWGYRGFGVYATKSAFPELAMADQLAKTIAVDEVKSRLDQATEAGFPFCPLVEMEGWWLL